MKRYNCHYGLKAEETSFESLHCAIFACMGANPQSKAFMKICASCENYIDNVRAADIKELAEPVGIEARVGKL